MSYLLHKLQSMVLVVSAVGWLTTEFAVVCWIGGEIFRDVNAEKHARMKTRAKAIFFAFTRTAQVMTALALLLWAGYWLSVASGFDPLPYGFKGALASAGILAILVLTFAALLIYLAPRHFRRIAVRSLIMFGALGTLSCSLSNIASESPAPSPVAYPTSAPLAPRAGGQVREFHLTAGQFPWVFVKGQPTTAWGYNGQVPGPELRVREGDLVRVAFTNNLPEPTTVHWHGVNVPTNMDGVPGISQDAVPPGGTFTYEFIASPVGTRWYHAHVAEQKQLQLGLYGPLIIEPATQETTHYDRDYTVVLGEWSPNAAKPGPNMPNSGMGGGMTGTGPSGMGGGNMMSAPDDPSTMFTVNGRAFPAGDPLVAHQGERVRLRLINASALQKHIIQLDGHTMRITHTDGNPLPTPLEVDTLEIGPGERYDVEVSADQPGVWFLRCVRPGHAARGMQILMRYEGVSFDGRESADARPSHSLRNWPDSALRQSPPASAATRPDKVYQLTLSGGMMMSTDGEWTINGKAYPNTEPLLVKAGERIRVRLFNMSMEDHPMHLHGHSFTVFQYDGRPIAPMTRDTIDVRPMESYDIEFVANNTGTWFFHCHNAMHMEGGLITLVKYQ